MEIKPDLVNFEQAKGLKKVGFPQNQKSLHYGFGYSRYGNLIYPAYNNTIYHPYEAPTLEIAARWLRYEKGILTIPKAIQKTPNEFVYQDWVKIKNKPGFVTTGCIFSIYEQALSAGITKAIEILKNN